MIDLTKNISGTVRRTRSSAIRELLKMIDRPSIISFAGGLPSPTTFPTSLMEGIITKVLKEKPHYAFQYGVTEGTMDLKVELIKYLKAEEGLELSPENILITSSSQQALDIVGRTFIDPSDPILVELPSYLGALQVFGSYGAQMVGIGMDNNGILVDDLEEKLNRLKDEEAHYKFLYVVPDFQNPTGVTMAGDRREKVVELAQKYQLLLIEDTPYRQVRFSGKRLPMLHSLDKNNNTISLFTFSKTLCPGLRLGYIVAPEEIIKKMTILKQSLDLCTSPFLQLIVAEYIKAGHFDRHLPKIIAEYTTKKNKMVETLEKYMPKNAGVSWTNPEGGLFLWVTLPTHVDTGELFKEAIKEDVAYVIGAPFFCDNSGHHTMRLNFSYPSLEQIEEGIKRLSNVVKKALIQK